MQLAAAEPESLGVEDRQLERESLVFRIELLAEDPLPRREGPFVLITQAWISSWKRSLSAHDLHLRLDRSDRQAIGGKQSPQLFGLLLRQSLLRFPALAPGEDPAFLRGEPGEVRPQRMESLAHRRATTQRVALGGRKLMCLSLPGNLCGGAYGEFVHRAFQTRQRPWGAGRVEELAEMTGMNGNMDPIGPVSTGHKDAQQCPVVSEQSAAEARLVEVGVVDDPALIGVDRGGKRHSQRLPESLCRLNAVDLIRRGNQGGRGRATDGMDRLADGNGPVDRRCHGSPPIGPLGGQQDELAPPIRGSHPDDLAGFPVVPPDPQPRGTGDD